MIETGRYVDVLRETTDEIIAKEGWASPHLHPGCPSYEFYYSLADYTKRFIDEGLRRA